MLRMTSQKFLKDLYPQLYMNLIFLSIKMVSDTTVIKGTSWSSRARLPAMLSSPSFVRRQHSLVPGSKCQGSAGGPYPGCVFLADRECRDVVDRKRLAKVWYLPSTDKGLYLMPVDISVITYQTGSWDPDFQVTVFTWHMACTSLIFFSFSQNQNGNTYCQSP